MYAPHQNAPPPLTAPHATILAFLERLLEREALRVRVRVTVLLRVRLELLTPPARLEEEGVTVAGSREGELLRDREGLADGLTGTVRLAKVVRAAESEGVRLGDAEEEDELEEVSEFELLEVPVEVSVGVPALLPEALPVPEVLRVLVGLSEGAPEEVGVPPLVPAGVDVAAPLAERVADGDGGV